ncbi:MAG: PDZ domain-containing protein [Planctomycetes bacterium]|nr:PDZ domain-containing protein [Planctomycetota bacterium]
MNHVSKNAIHPLCVCALAMLAASGCQYGMGSKPVAPFGDSTLGLYARMTQSEHFFNDLGASGTQRVMVTKVKAGGPAYLAGIRPGDFILKVNGHTCRDAESLIRYVRNLEPGTVARVKIYQRGKSKNVKVAVARSVDVWGNTPNMSFKEMVEPEDVNKDWIIKEKHEDEAETVPGLYTN